MKKNGKPRNRFTQIHSQVIFHKKSKAIQWIMDALDY